GHNQIKRKATLDKLVKLAKPLYPGAHINYLPAKIGGLRSPYNSDPNPDYIQAVAEVLEVWQEEEEDGPTHTGEKRLGTPEDTRDPPPPKEGEVTKNQAEDEEGNVLKVGEIVTTTGDLDVEEEESHFTSDSAQILIGATMGCKRDLENIKHNINDVQQKIKKIIDGLGRI
ncbi:hypothetical protein AB205_0072030, partial [Aquarana catesbeiana]